MTRRALSLSVFVLGLLLLASPMAASPIVIDLEGLADGDVLANQIPGMTFTNATILTAGISLNEFELPPASGLKVAFDAYGPIRIDFSSPLAAFGGHFTYLVPVTLEAFDSLNNSLGSISSAFGSNLGLSGDLGSLPNEFLELAFANIASVTLTGDVLGESFAVDDFVVTPMAVPEPHGLWLSLLGAGVLISRRRTIGRL
jgi:hypothetical protein